MKKFAFFTGAISVSLTSLGALFLIQHWPGGHIGCVLGIGVFSILFIPSMTMYLYDKIK
ncbi:MAG: hypothetical protein V1781_09290 [Bacteroidota bacterium]